MHIVNCDNPRTVVNPHTGEKVRVRCGKCAQCMNAKAKKWINKLSVEAQYHRYAFMVNLTFDNYHLPRLVLDKNNNLVFKNRNLPLCIPLQDLFDIIDNSYQDQAHKDREKEYLLARLKHRLGLPVCCSDDVSKFNKRLNKYFHDHITKRYQNFRFFLAHEYGPTTFRPHLHGIYYFDDPRIEACFLEAVHSCWQNGDTSAANIFSNGGFSYVAQYVNMSVHLPSFYSHKDLRQRHQFSKCPPLGFDSLPLETLRQLYSERPTYRTVWDSSSARYVTLPVNSTFKDRYFPKCPGYNNISDFSRIGLYRAVEFLPSTDFDEFSEAVYSIFCRMRSGKLSSLTFLPGITPYLQGILDYIPSLHMDTVEHRLVSLKLRKWFNISKRFCFIRDSLGVSSDYVLNCINEFYKKLDYERLKDFYFFQVNYLDLNPGRLLDLVFMYPDMVDYFRSLKSDEYPDNDLYVNALESFGISDLGTFDYSDTLDFKGSSSRASDIYKDTHKAHEKNEYLYSERFKYLDPELQKIMIAYAS